MRLSNLHETKGTSWDHERLRDFSGTWDWDLDYEISWLEFVRRFSAYIKDRFSMSNTPLHTAFPHDVVNVSWLLYRAAHPYRTTRKSQDGTFIPALSRSSLRVQRCYLSCDITTIKIQRCDQNKKQLSSKDLKLESSCSDSLTSFIRVQQTEEKVPSVRCYDLWSQTISHATISWDHFYFCYLFYCCYHLSFDTLYFYYLKSNGSPFYLHYILDHLIFSFLSWFISFPI